jgi:hypothetical protein
MNDLTKYFFNRCFELLHKKAFDTYRVSLHNPYTIFKELDKSIDSFNKKRIKHYDPTITSIGEEAKFLIDINFIEEIFLFKTFTKKQIEEILSEKCIKGKIEFNRTISLMCKSILTENYGFTKKLFERISELLIENNLDNSFKVDKFASWLVTQLLYRGYSRKFVNNRFRKAHELIAKGEDIHKIIDRLSNDYSRESVTYKTIFKLKSDSITNLKLASQFITKIDLLPHVFLGSKYINSKFKELEENEIYVEIEINSLDFWAALKSSHQIISETVEINILHQTENKIVIENQALVYDDASKAFRMEPIEVSLDGYYDYNEHEFNRFIENYKHIKSTVAKEKLRSAIRFYKLGNDSLEIEHKILNYWIGFEQLFSSVDSNEDSIKRIKIFYVALSCCYYLQRRANYLLFLTESKKYTNAGNKIELNDLKKGLTDNLTFENQDPLLEKRLKKYINDFNSNHTIFEYLKLHKLRLGLHLTRIYKIRNELVHEGKTSVDLNLVASHLRHYLLFSIEQITNEINENPLLEHLDDVFIYYENLYNRIIKANNVEEIFEIKEFTGYME